MSPTTVEHLDVLVVGAGLSGICAGHYVQADCPWASYAIFEARDSIGGTWDLFRYPGVRSDSDMFTLGYPFRPWASDRMIVDGGSILQYIKDTAADEGIDEHIRYRHRIVRAEWSSREARWHITVERTDTGETVEVTCGFLLSCSGYYRYDHGYLPDFPGMDRYAGTIVHPQAWPEDLDHAGARVVVIGSGATAVTLVPALAATAAQVTMLQRSPTYVASLPGRNPAVGLIQRVLPDRLSGPIIRWVHAIGTQAAYQLSRRRPNLIKRLLRFAVRRELPAGYDIDTHFTPRYDPWDQRMCLVPDGDLFKAIGAGSAQVVTDHIDTFTETGLRLQSGAEIDADIIVTATGLELLFVGGVELAVDGEVVDLPSTLTYKGMMLDGVPNFAFAVGYTNASWTLKCDLTSQFVARLLRHMAEHGYTRVAPRRDPAVPEEPLLDFTSGYVLRAVEALPHQGTRFPWKLYQNYIRDLWLLGRGRLGGSELERTRDGSDIRDAPRPAITRARG